MPFTFAHPAIVLPFSKIKSNRVSLSALIIGSMTPDFEYILQMKLEGRYSHSLEGIFVMDVPIGLALFFVFHLIIKQTLLPNLPAYFRGRLQPISAIDAIGYARQYPLALLVCLIVGIASHIFWDGFTHARGDFVSMYPALSIHTDGSWPLFRYLQHASTAVGFGFIAWVFHRMKMFPVEQQPIDYRFWMLAAAIATIVFCIRWWFGFEYYGYVVVSLMSASLMGIVLSSLIFRNQSQVTQ